MRPADWHSRWYLQEAHIASGGGRARRVIDDRAVILLCPRCHDCHVSDSNAFSAKTINGIEYPTIDERHTIWIKQDVDGKVDIEFLKTFWIGIPPEPERPPDFWCKRFTDNTGRFR